MWFQIPTNDRSLSHCGRGLMLGREDVRRNSSADCSSHFLLTLEPIVYIFSPQHFSVRSMNTILKVLQNPKNCQIRIVFKWWTNFYTSQKGVFFSTPLNGLPWCMPIILCGVKSLKANLKADFYCPCKITPWLQRCTHRLRILTEASLQYGMASNMNI